MNTQPTHSCNLAENFFRGERGENLKVPHVHMYLTPFLTNGLSCIIVGMLLHHWLGDHQRVALTLNLDLVPRRGGLAAQTSHAPALSHIAPQEAKNCCKCPAA